MQCLANFLPRRVIHRHDVTFYYFWNLHCNRRLLLTGTKIIIKVEKETGIYYVKNINITRTSLLDLIDEGVKYGTPTKRVCSQLKMAISSFQVRYAYSVFTTMPNWNYFPAETDVGLIVFPLFPPQIVEISGYWITAECNWPIWSSAWNSSWIRI